MSVVESVTLTIECLCLSFPFSFRCQWHRYLMGRPDERLWADLTSGVGNAERGGDGDGVGVGQGHCIVRSCGDTALRSLGTTRFVLGSTC